MTNAELILEAKKATGMPLITEIMNIRTLDLFEDIDIISETKSYYQEVFGITLTDAQAASIFTPTAQAGSGF